MIDTAIGQIQDPVQRFFAFIKERHSVTLKRQRGEPKPWTLDTILQSYRFCSAYRELDAVTIWIRKNWREPHADDPDLWFAMVIARLLNQPESLGALGWPVPWSRVHFLQILKLRRDKKLRNFNSAYMITNAGHAMFKEIYLADYTLEPLWRAKERLRPRRGDTLNSYHMLLGQFHGFGSFLAAQVVADLKYTPPFAGAQDWHSFAASGPGSRRGLNRVLGRGVKDNWAEEDWRAELGRLRAAVEPMFAAAAMEMPHNQDLQNCNCEFDKYERARLGEGRPKQLYPGV